MTPYSEHKNISYYFFRILISKTDTDFEKLQKTSFGNDFFFNINSIYFKTGYTTRKTRVDKLSGYFSFSILNNLANADFERLGKKEKHKFEVSIYFKASIPIHLFFYGLHRYKGKCT